MVSFKSAISLLVFYLSICSLFFPSSFLDLFFKDSLLLLLVSIFYNFFKVGSIHAQHGAWTHDLRSRVSGSTDWASQESLFCVFLKYFLVFPFISMLVFLPILLCFIFRGCSIVVVLTSFWSQDPFTLLQIEDPKKCFCFCGLHLPILNHVKRTEKLFLLIYFKIINSLRVNRIDTFLLKVIFGGGI